MSAPTVIDYQSTKMADPADRLRVGTLKYTMKGLLWVFCWLLWGDFCYTVMEQVNWNIIPLTLKHLEAPDWVLPIILSTIPGIINLVSNPLISTASDRHRGRWGRRIPFLLFSAPFISLTLVMLAFSPEISTKMMAWFGPWTGWSAISISIVTLGFLVATFKIFDMFLNTAFWYLFNDVVPEAFLGRFMGLFRVVGCLAAGLFHYFIFEHSITHMRVIYLGAAAIYLVGFSLMCLFVKEGEYPPPAPMAPKSDGLLKRMITWIKVYGTECLSHRLYWYFFLHGVFLTLANTVAVYQTFLNLSVGITMHQLGTMNAVIQFVVLALAYPAGSLVDRIHPMRVAWYMEIALLFIAPMNFIWMYAHFTPTSAYYTMIGLQAVDLPISLLASAAGMPLMMRLLPKDRYGQFCSFNAMCGAVATIAGGAVVGLFMTGMRWLFPDDVWGKDYCYRLMPAWRVPFMVIALGILWLMIREWKRLGGAEHYRPPGTPSEETLPAV